MPKENDKTSRELITHLEQAQVLISEALALAKTTTKSTSTKKPHQPKEKAPANELDFSMPIRAFVKRHGKGMSGPKKFTLLLGYLANGDLNKTVPFTEIKKQWSKMTSKALLGMEFNTYYTSPAKENDWVHSEKNGSYNLRPSWKMIFDE